MKRWKEFILIGIIIFGLIYILYEIPTQDENIFNNTDYQMTLSICMYTDVLLYLEECKKFISEFVVWCNDSSQSSESICSKPELNELFSNIDQRIDLARIDLEGTGIISNETLKPYIITEKIKNIAVIIPTFTKIAYSGTIFADQNYNGFYAYFNGECDESCLTLDLDSDVIHTSSSSFMAVHVLESLGYNLITDRQLDKNPKIINTFDEIIILHNEYITKNEFDAITNHPKVTYLYPNALFAEIEVDYEKNTMTLIRGHGYNTESFEGVNAFEWKYDNTEYEFDRQCINWKFYKIDNGRMLNCYPEWIMSDDNLLNEIKRGVR